MFFDYFSLNELSTDYPLLSSSILDDHAVSVEFFGNFGVTSKNNYIV